LPWSTCGC
jgi:predicted pyridoxine 5'-phosphate oxidase superfamily flavin-nucleotide-binding protein